MAQRIFSLFSFLITLGCASVQFTRSGIKPSDQHAISTGRISGINPVIDLENLCPQKLFVDNVVVKSDPLAAASKTVLSVVSFGFFSEYVLLYDYSCGQVTK